MFDESDSLFGRTPNTFDATPKVLAVTADIFDEMKNGFETSLGTLDETEKAPKT